MAHRGKSLKALREAKQITLRKIANETRIGVAYLKDLEQERFERFPGKFYFKSFAREYAVALGLEPDEIVDDLVTAYEEWSGEAPAETDGPESEPSHDGLLHRIAGYVRGVQSEV